MRLPRWTVYPALAVLAAFLIPGVPWRSADKAPAPSGAVTTSPKTKFKKVVVLGIDGMDPVLLQQVISRFPERMKNFARLARECGIHPLGTSTPPQSPVAWSNFITGLDAGGHGIFDFIHRDPMTRQPAPCTVKIGEAEHLDLWGDWQFPLGGASEANRTGKAFWTVLAEHGVPAHIWRMPANFPVEPADGLSFSGMMTPAIDSAYGKYSFYTSDPPAESAAGDTKIIAVRDFDGVIDTFVQADANPFKASGENVTVPLRIYIDAESGGAALETCGTVALLKPGQWSDFVRVKFEPLPGGVGSYSGVVRFHLRRLSPFELYMSPVNIDPLEPRTPISAPVSASADAAKAIGIFYTQGMPEDVTALKHGVLTEEEFLEQSDLVHVEGERILEYACDKWLEDGRGGFLFLYFSGVDLCGHMLWRHHDEAHPHHDPVKARKDTSQWSHREGSTWKDVVADLYLRMDPVVGRLRERAGDDATFVVMSDHGFASYRRKFSLNTWLLENGYLVLQEGRTKELREDAEGFSPVSIASAVDWSRTRAYGVGFNGLYLNLKGREKDDPATPANESGIVEPGAAAEALVDELKAKLEAIIDGDFRVVVRADRARDVFNGARLAEAPDLVVGYNAGYGNSDEASLGRIPHDVLADNLGGTFNGSHLMVPDVVPGILLSNGAVVHGPKRLEDLTVEILKQYGIEPEAGMRGSPVLR